jgi:hypothetical protein
MAMDYQIDLDPTHSVVLLTVTAEIVTLELADDIYIRLVRLASRGGPYAAIYDLSRAKDTTMTTAMVRSYARRPPSIPMGRPHVVVGEAPTIYGLARVFQMCREHVYGLFDVVRSLDEAYEIVGARPEDFTERLFPARLAA